MAVKFGAVTKHGALTFPPATALAFDDPDAEPYFVAAGFAEATDDEAVMTYPEGSVAIDPETVFGSGEQRGQKVLGD